MQAILNVAHVPVLKTQYRTPQKFWWCFSCFLPGSYPLRSLLNANIEPQNGGNAIKKCQTFVVRPQYDVVLQLTCVQKPSKTIKNPQKPSKTHSFHPLFHWKSMHSLDSHHPGQLCRRALAAMLRPASPRPMRCPSQTRQWRRRKRCLS